MEVDEKKEVCATCGIWGGKREKKDPQVVSVSASAKGLCSRHNKLKPSQGGCNLWEKWERTEGG